MTKVNWIWIPPLAVAFLCPQKLRAQALPPHVAAPACYEEWLEVSPAHFTTKWLTSYARRVATREGHRTLVDLRIRIADKYTGPRGLPGTSLGRTYAMWHEQYRKVLAWRDQSAALLCLRGACRFSIRFADGTVKERIWGKHHLANLLSRESTTHILFAHVAGPTPQNCFLRLFVRTSRKLEEATGLAILEQIDTPGIDTVFIVIRNDSWFISDFGAPVFDFYGPPEQPPTREDYSHSRTLHCSRLPNRPSSCGILTHVEGTSQP